MGAEDHLHICERSEECLVEMTALLKREVGLLQGHDIGAELLMTRSPARASAAGLCRSTVDIVRGDLILREPDSSSVFAVITLSPRRIAPPFRLCAFSAI